MGDKLIQVSPGSDSGKLVQNGDVIASVNPMDVDRLMNKLTGIAENAESITGDLADMFSKVNNGQGTLGRLLNDDKLSKNLEATIESANKTVKTIDKAADGVSQNMEAAKHNFLFRGYFKKKEKQRIEDSTKRAKAIQDSLNAKGANKKVTPKN
jgi:phospholipid/cholesterol/gamma-HCH transport system substrate-binding protein